MTDDLIRWSHCSAVRVRAKQPEPKAIPVQHLKPTPVRSKTLGELLSNQSQHALNQQMFQNMLSGQQQTHPASLLGGLGMRGLFG